MKRKVNKKIQSRRQKYVLLENAVGWYGALATLSAYFMVSFGYASPRDMNYQLLNLSGAIGLGIICYFKRTYQPLFVNIVWSAIAILAIVNILFFLKS